MATKASNKTEEPVVVVNNIDRSEEYVDFIIPLTSPDDRPVFIGVNGDAIRVKPGVNVKVKRKFVEAWEHSMEAKREAMQTRINAQKASKRALAEL